MSNKKGKDSLSRKIPALVRRQLRKESYFGCCACGSPFVEYHHIIEFATYEHHNPEDMMCLCPTHHHEAHSMSDAKQKKWKKNPFNLANGNVNGILHINQSNLVISLGGIEFVGEGFKIVVDGESLVEVEKDSDDQLLISLILYDDKGRKLFEIIQNEWAFGDFELWDFEFTYQHLKIRELLRKVILEIDSRNEPVLVNGELWRSKHLFKLQNKGITFEGNGIGPKQVNFKDLCLVNSYIEINSKIGKFSISPFDAKGHSVVSDKMGSKARIIQGLIKYEELKLGIKR